MMKPDTLSCGDKLQFFSVKSAICMFIINKIYLSDMLDLCLVCLMLDYILLLQLITAKLGNSLVSLEIKITSSMRRTESTIGFFHFPVWDLLLPLAYTPDRRDQQLLMSLLKDMGKVG